MPVVINEFEVVPREEAEAGGPRRAEDAPEPSPRELRHELERTLAVRRERELRLRAD